MALNPSLSICLKDSCKKLQFTDDTGVYDASNKTGGWETPNTAGSAVTAVTITITLPDASTQTATVTTQVPSTVTGNFVYDDVARTDSSKWTDGIYKFVYKVTEGSTNYSTTIYKYFDCNVDCCVDEMAATVAGKYLDSTSDYKNSLDDYLEAVGLLEGGRAAVSANKTASNATILAKVQRLCDFTNCNCD
jgi:hypothetical protein